MAAIFQLPVLAQVKTNFTKEVRPSDSNPTGLASAEHIEEHNKVDVKVPKKTRGVERYNKLNIWGNVIPDSFLFFRNTLNQNQKAVLSVFLPNTIIRLMNQEILAENFRLLIPVQLNTRLFVPVMQPFFNITCRILGFLVPMFAVMVMHGIF